MHSFKISEVGIQIRSKNKLFLVRLLFFFCFFFWSNPKRFLCFLTYFILGPLFYFYNNDCIVPLFRPGRESDSEAEDMEHAEKLRQVKAVLEEVSFFS